MGTFDVVLGENLGERSKRATKVGIMLAAAWEREVVIGRMFDAAAEAHPNSRCRAKLRVLAAFSRAHSSRLLNRLSVYGRGVLPVPTEVDEAPSLRYMMDSANSMATWYETAANVARQSADLSTAWIYELNRTECLDAAREIMAMEG